MSEETRNPEPAATAGLSGAGKPLDATDRPPEGERPWPRVGVWRRFGPSLLVVLAIVAAGTVATVHERAKSAAASSPGSTSKTRAHHRSNNPADNPELPIYYAQAKQEGKLASYTWQPGCDTATGRLDIPSAYAPPCVPAYHGHAAGSTWQGVTSTTITLVYYVAPPGDLSAALPGETDTPAESLATVKAFVSMFNKVFETYGRQVKLVIFKATGISTDAVAAKADALAVGEQLHAFASIGGPGQTSVYEDELARLHVLCVGCGISVPYSDFQADAPYLWDQLPVTDTQLTEAFDFVVGELLGKDAIYAGEQVFRHEKRVFGFVHYDQNPPVFGSLAARLDREFAGDGFTAKVSESYLLVLSQLPADATNIIAHLKAAGVTTVIFAGDPIMPIYLTAEAAKQDYFPEWIITGTVFTDTATLGRLYNQQEWAHAFGITSLAVSTPIDLSAGWEFYRWFYGTRPPALKTSSVILAGLAAFFTGVDLAGPTLTPVTYEGGLFKAPPVGGTPTDPLVAYGYHGAPPTPAYSYPDDYAVIWYDATAVGPDEEGVMGKGLIRYVDGGKRFSASVIPRETLGLFDQAGSVSEITSLPSSSNANAPPWPGSPAARRSS
jgi:hypothetical protein